MTAVETVTSCVNCASRRLRRWCRGRDRLHEISDRHFLYSRCRDCGTVLQSVRPTETDIGLFYPADYAPYAAPATPTVRVSATLPDRIARRAASAIRGRSVDRCPGMLDEFYQPSAPGSLLLDFGSGSDVFLNRARELGWSTLGIDVAPATIELLRLSGHRALLLGADTWDAIEDETLSAVRMNHVLEHLYAPRETLAQLHRKLAPNGRLHIAVPNPASLTARVFRSYWFSLDCPRHIALYPPTALQDLLSSCGFSVDAVCHETVTRDITRSIGYVLQERGWIGRDQVHALAHRASLNDALYGLARAAAAMGAADRYHTFALKPG